MSYYDLYPVPDATSDFEQINDVRWPVALLPPFRSGGGIAASPISLSNVDVVVGDMIPVSLPSAAEADTKLMCDSSVALLTLNRKTDVLIGANRPIKIVSL